MLLLFTISAVPAAQTSRRQFSAAISQSEKISAGIPCTIRTIEQQCF